MAYMLAVIDELRQQNVTLQDNVHHLQLQCQADPPPEDEPLEAQPVSQEILEDAVPEKFQAPSFATYDEKTDPHEHIITINNQMAVLGPTESLKCKFMGRTIKDVALRWYMSLPWKSITSYQDLIKKLVQHFSVIRHRKVSTTTLFTLLQEYFESLREYLECFKEETIKVSHPN